MPVGRAGGQRGRQHLLGNGGGTTLSFVNQDGSGGGGDVDTGATSVDAPTGTAIDAAAGRIYWANNGPDAIRFANLDGSGGGGTLNDSGATTNGIRGIVLDKAGGGSTGPTRARRDLVREPR